MFVAILFTLACRRTQKGFGFTTVPGTTYQPGKIRYKILYKRERERVDAPTPLLPVTRPAIPPTWGARSLKFGRARWEVSEIHPSRRSRQQTPVAGGGSVGRIGGQLFSRQTNKTPKLDREKDLVGVVVTNLTATHPSWHVESASLHPENVGVIAFWVSGFLSAPLRVWLRADPRGIGPHPLAQKILPNIRNTKTAQGSPTVVGLRRMPLTGHGRHKRVGRLKRVGMVGRGGRKMRGGLVERRTD